MPYASTSSMADKVVAITGGASGIGLATAHLLASRGASLSLADVSESGLEAASKTIRAKHNIEILTFTLDVRKPEQVDFWIAETVSRFGKLDGAANIAGVIPKNIGVGGIAEMEVEEWDFVIGVNLTGVMHCMRAQMRVIADGGSIVNASSIAGLIGRPNNAAYAASKHGVIGLTKSAAKEIGVRGVRVNSFAPGYIITPMTDAAVVTDGDAKSESMRVPLGRHGIPEECASVIAFLLGDESTYITGATYSVDGGWNS
ncbi:ABA4 protein [Pleomassaria siparia CBS 279.74]|uniref:ABA4 protein n=1 Tax=Pleomassaria siparia CBS 279.74 TaxID=1314801 RepID=A0A6G1KL92_9PLEO|nr:ABA4 protein [Pleomassaria siparia CBS 279.74]